MRARIMQYHFSGELNFVVENQDVIVDRLLEDYADGEISRLDGVRFDYADWWFIVRKSSTEPYLRLIVEARNREELRQRTDKLTNRITDLQGEAHAR